MVSFVDPIHSLITLEGKDEDCLEAIGPGFERLKKMKQLGWVSEAFPGARHSKWEHAMGTYHLGTLATASGRHVPGVDAHQFRVACAAHVVGTPAYGYPSARGILMAMESSAKVRSQVTNLCTSVSERLTKLPGGSEVNWLAFARRPDTESIQRWFAVDDLVTRIPNRDGGALVIGVARTLLDRTQLANRFVDLFHTLDYVLRDLYNTGIANLRMNYELILETIQHVTNPEELDGILQGMPEWQVVESVRELLTLQVYWDSQVLTAETVFAKAIAKALADGLFEISALQIDDDESLYSRLMNTKIRDLYELPGSLRKRHLTLFKDDEIITILEGNWAKVERSLVKAARLNPMTYPIQARTLLVLDARPRGLGTLRARVLWRQDSDRARPLLALLSQLQRAIEIPYIRIEVDFRRKVGEAAIKALMSRYPSVSFGSSAIDGLANYIKQDHQKVRALLPQAFTPKALEEQSSFIAYGPAGRELQAVSKYLPFELSFIAREKVSEAAFRRFSTYLVSNFHAFRQQFLEKLLTRLAAYIEEHQQPSHAEAGVMLREMLNVSRSEFSWTIPNVQCFNAKGEIEREIDVVTVLLPRSGTKAEVRLTECTLNREPHKSVSDAKKLVELKSELQGRFKDVQVETRVYGGDPGVHYSDLIQALRKKTRN